MRQNYINGFFFFKVFSGTVLLWRTGCYFSSLPASEWLSLNDRHMSHVTWHHVNQELQERISCQAIELRQKDFELKKTTEDLDRAQAQKNRAPFAEL